MQGDLSGIQAGIFFLGCQSVAVSILSARARVTTLTACRWCDALSLFEIWTDAADQQTTPVRRRSRKSAHSGISDE